MSSNKTKITLTVDNNDPLAKYSIEGVAKFSTGVDNMNDSFKIGTGSTLANPALEIIISRPPSFFETELKVFLISLGSFE